VAPSPANPHPEPGIEARGHDAPGAAPGSSRRRAVLARILESVPDRRRVVVAVDGVGASGKSTFAAELADQAGPRPVVVIHADDFFHPADIRHARGRLSAEGFWLDTYNYDALISWALAPLSSDGGGLYRTASFDRATGATTCPNATQAPDDALVIVEGAFLHRDELAGFWDYSVFLDVPVDEANRRMVDRGGLDKDSEAALLRRYNGAQELYFTRARPWERASVVLDNSDVTAPAVIDAAKAHAAR